MDESTDIILRNKNEFPIRKERVYPTEPIDESTLPVITKKCLLAYFNSPLVKDMPEIDVRKYVMTAINRAMYDTSFSLERIGDVYQEVGNDVLSYFTHLTITEIEYAFHLGVRKKLGEFYGLNVASFFQFLENYTNIIKNKALDTWEKYKESLNRRMEAEKIQADKIQQEKNTRKIIQEGITIIQNYIDGKIQKFSDDDGFIENGSLVFDSLLKNSLIKPSKEETDKYFNEAENFYYIQCKNEKKSPENNTVIMIIKNIAKDYALSDFIEKSKKEKVNLLSLFNKAINETKAGQENQKKS